MCFNQWGKVWNSWAGMWRPSRFCSWTNLYLLYPSPLADILRLHKMSFHIYADDTQLYVSFLSNDISELNCTMANIEKCLTDIDTWMTLNKLKLNKDKTELIFLSSKHCPQQFLPSLHFGSDLILPSKSARNIGVVFDNTVSMLPHVKFVCKTAFYHLRNIARIRKFLSVKTTEILVHAFASHNTNLDRSSLATHCWTY